MLNNIFQMICGALHYPVEYVPQAFQAAVLFDQHWGA